MDVKHALGLVSQESSSLQEDLAASHHGVLGHEAGNWRQTLQ